MDTKKLSTPDVARMCGCDISTAEKWAIKAHLEAVSIGKKKYRLWTEDDIACFLVRPKPGKRAKKKPVLI